MPNPTAAMLVIGDEILSGRTRDANMYHLAGQLTGQGIDLKEVRVVSDDPEAIVNATRALSAAYTHVFTSGGIGPTHDDITADCIAAAFGVSIGVRADARAILQAHYDANGQELNERTSAHGTDPRRGVPDRQSGEQSARFYVAKCACDGGGALNFSGHARQHSSQPHRRQAIAQCHLSGRSRRGGYRGTAWRLGRCFPAVVHRLLSIPKRRAIWREYRHAQHR